VLLALLGLTSIVVLDSVSYLISGLLLGALSVPQRRTSAGVSAGATGAAGTLVAMWREWHDGLHLMAREHRVALLLLLIAASYVAEGLALVAWVPYMQQVVRTTAFSYGWIAGVGALGALIGSLALGSTSRRVAPLSLVIGGFGALGMLYLLLALSPGLLVVLVLVFLVGAPIVALDVSLTTLLQRAVPDRYRGRVFGTLETTIAMVVLAGLVLGGLVGGSLGVRLLLALAGSIDLAFGLVALCLLRPQDLAEDSATVDGESPLMRDQAQATLPP
jgi:predicted MFS family arabinose efflux permease